MLVYLRDGKLMEQIASRKLAQDLERGNMLRSKPRRVRSWKIYQENVVGFAYNVYEVLYRQEYTLAEVEDVHNGVQFQLLMELFIQIAQA